MLDVNSLILMLNFFLNVNQIYKFLENYLSVMNIFFLLMYLRDEVMLNVLRRLM